MKASNIRLRSSAGSPGRCPQDRHQRSVRGARESRWCRARRELDGVRQQIVEDQANLAAVGQRRQIFDVHIEPRCAAG
jgi:hypothetical protein